MPENQKNQMHRSFCLWYAVLGDAGEAAAKAGFPQEDAMAQAVAILSREQNQRRISQIRSALSDTQSVISGLKRLAFGSCNDAVYLAFAEELPPPDVIRRLDLFGVSEIKRVKGGGVEVKLADRLKALEKLHELQNTLNEKETAESLIRALAGEEADTQ